MYFLFLDKGYNEEEDQFQQQQKILGLENLTRNSTDYEDEGLKQQIFKHARSTINPNYNTTTLTNIGNNNNNAMNFLNNNTLSN